MTDRRPDSPQPDETPMDVRQLFPHPDALADVERDARARVQLTHAGHADTVTGTVRLAHEVDDDAEITQLPAPRRTLPTALLDREVWSHRIDVVLHSAGFHLARSPRYAGRMGYLMALGAWTELRTACNYLLARDDFGQMIDETKRNNYGADHLAQLRADRRKERRARLRENTTVLGLTGFTTYTTALVALATVWGMGVTAPFLVPAVGFLAACGVRELGRRTEPFEVFEQAVAAEDAPLTDATINAVLHERKVFTDESHAIQLVGPIRETSINASLATFKLPSGITAQRLIANKDAIAEGLNVEPSWLDIEQDGHPSRVSMWIASSDPLAKARVSPLISAPERQDVYNHGAVIAFTRRGRTFYLPLRHVMVLLGGMSRTGKGMILRNLICALGLDPRINIRLAAGAKPGEHIGYAPVCATFFGRRPERVYLLLQALLAEAYRREAYLEEQGRAKMNERDLELFPWEIAIIDEAQEHTNDPEFGDDIAELLGKLSGFVAALNMTIVLVTQDPDKNTVPRKFKSNSAVRVATKTGSPTQTNAILKEGATGAGMRAHELSRDIPGAAIADVDGLVGELVRSFFIEDDAHDGAEPIIRAGLQLRLSLHRAPGQFFDPIEAFLQERTGTSSVAGGPDGRGKPGHPALTSATLHRSLLTDLLGIFAARNNPERLRTVEILAALAEADPATWSPKAIGVEEDDEKSWASRGGTKLNKMVAQELDGTGRSLTSKEWTAGGRGRGYYLTDVRAAAGIAPE
jgi:S-DNA-T family DNA segregation ATPase FtsK/SpoIIIE